MKYIKVFMSWLVSSLVVVCALLLMIYVTTQVMKVQ